MTDPDREARKRGVDERLAGINERLDRLTLMLLQTSSNKSEALDRLERALDQAESSDG